MSTMLCTTENSTTVTQRWCRTSLIRHIEGGRYGRRQVTKEPRHEGRVVTILLCRPLPCGCPPRLDWYLARIADEAERSRLRSLAKQMRPEGVGLIVRTEAQGRSEHELLQDVEFLSHVWSEVEARAERLSAPALLYKDYDLIYRIARDRFTDDVDKLVVDDSQLYRRLRTLIASLSPELSGRVYLYHEGPPIFAAYGIEDQIDSALDRKVWLDCGGYLVIDHTEALTSIDVNTGRFIGTTNLADTVLRTNLEASVEIARQLRLRDIGGIIIVDFIDMESKEDEEKVLRVLEQEVSRDRTRTHSGLTNLGFVRTRKKLRRDIEDVFYKTSDPLRQRPNPLRNHRCLQGAEEIKRVARATDDEAILVACHPSVAAVIIGSVAQTCAGWKRLRARPSSCGERMASTFRTCGSWRWARGRKWSASRSPYTKGKCSTFTSKSPMCPIPATASPVSQDTCSTSKEPVSTSVRSCKSKSHGFSARTRRPHGGSPFDRSLRQVLN